MAKSETTPTALFVLLLGMLSLFVFNSSITSVASPFIVTEIGGDRTISFYPVAFLAYGSAITVPLSKPLFSRFGLYAVLRGGLFLFFLTNVLTGMMPTFFFVNVFRFFTGLAAGPCYALINQAVYLLAPPQKRTFFAWVTTTLLISMPVLGGVVGGVDAYLYHWQSSFFFDGTVGFILMLLLKRYKNVLFLSYKEGETFDWVGWVFYALAIFCLTFAITTSQQLDWYRSPTLVTNFFIGVPALAYFILRSFVHPSPVYQLRLFKSSLFTLSVIALAFVFSIYFGTVLLINLWLMLDVQFSPNWVSAILGIMALTMFLPYLVTKWLSQWDSRVFLVIASLVVGFNSFFTSTFWQQVNIGRLYIARALAGLGFAFALPAVAITLTQALPERKRIDAQEFFQGIRNLAIGLGASCFNIAWQRRAIFYHARLNEWLNLQNNNVQNFFYQKKVLQVPGDRFAELDQFLEAQSWTLGLEDCFFLMGWMTIAFLVLVGITFVLPKEEFDQRVIKVEDERTVP